MTDLSPNLSLTYLLSGISTDVQLLATQTIALARLEARAAASKLAWSAVAALAGVFIALAGTAVLVSALVLRRDRPRTAGMGGCGARRRRTDSSEADCRPDTSWVPPGKPSVTLKETRLSLRETMDG